MWIDVDAIFIRNRMCIIDQLAHHPHEPHFFATAWPSLVGTTLGESKFQNTSEEHPNVEEEQKM